MIKQGQSIPDRVLASQPDGDPNILAERDQKSPLVVSTSRIPATFMAPTKSVYARLVQSSKFVYKSIMSTNTWPSAANDWRVKDVLEEGWQSL